MCSSDLETFKNSRYFQLAGEFAQPIENLIPRETLDTIRNKAKEVGGKSDEKDDNTAEKDKAFDAEEEKETPSKGNEDLFEKLAQPQVKSKAADKKKAAKIEENFDGYNVHERDNLDRLIENSLD